jgi:hypothetical protein
VLNALPFSAAQRAPDGRAERQSLQALPSKRNTVNLNGAQGDLTHGSGRRLKTHSVLLRKPPISETFQCSAEVRV